MFLSKKDKVKAEGTEPVEKQIKVSKLRSESFNKPLRIAIWLILLFILFKGIYTSIKPSDMGAIKREVAGFEKQVLNDKSVHFEASAFAERFINEYFTYSKNNSDDYQQRVSKYLPNFLTERMIPKQQTAQVLYVKAYKVVEISQNQYDVYVNALVQYEIAKVDQTGTNATTQTVTKPTNLIVPLERVKDQYCLEDLPILVAEENTTQADNNQFKGKSAEDTESKQINDMLSNFFKAYYEQTNTQIQYFCLDSNTNIKGLEGRYKFKKIDTIQVYKLEGKYLATVQLTAIDLNEVEVPQDFSVYLKKNDNRWYVTRLGPRIRNLK